MFLILKLFKNMQIHIIQVVLIHIIHPYQAILSNTIFQ